MTTREMEEREGDSMTSEGEDYSVMYGRYDNPKICLVSIGGLVPECAE